MTTTDFSNFSGSSILFSGLLNGHLTDIFSVDICFILILGLMTMYSLKKCEKE